MDCRAVNQLASSPTGLVLQVNRLYHEELGKLVEDIQRNGLSVKTAELRLMTGQKDGRLINVTLTIEGEAHDETPAQRRDNSRWARLRAAALLPGRPSRNSGLGGSERGGGNGIFLTISSSETSGLFSKSFTYSGVNADFPVFRFSAGEVTVTPSIISSLFRDEELPA
ncbi:MAG: hypothetical protein ACLUEQ_04770 [Cloacibacillus evryensis]